MVFINALWYNTSHPYINECGIIPTTRRVDKYKPGVYPNKAINGEVRKSRVTVDIESKASLW